VMKVELLSRFQGFKVDLVLNHFLKLFSFIELLQFLV
jgi:hypothetical protein